MLTYSLPFNAMLMSQFLEKEYKCKEEKQDISFNLTKIYLYFGKYNVTQPYYC